MVGRGDGTRWSEDIGEPRADGIGGWGSGGFRAF